MELKNSSHWPDSFIRRMLSWVTQQVEPPYVNRRDYATGRVTRRTRLPRKAIFRKRIHRSYSGHASSCGQIVVSIGPAARFPTEHKGYVRACRRADGTYPVLSDQIDALVMVTAHEMGHIAQFRRGRFGRGSEDLADSRARYTFKAFREQRDKLVAEWSGASVEAPAPAVEVEAIPIFPALRLQGQREAKALADLKRWERRLKLAKSKVRKYRRRVKYYAKVMQQPLKRAAEGQS